MKQIRLFVASSLVEFKEERLELGNYIRSLNDIYVERGIYFKLDMVMRQNTLSVPQTRVIGKLLFQSQPLWSPTI